MKNIYFNLILIAFAILPMFSNAENHVTKNLRTELNRYDEIIGKYNGNKTILLKSATTKLSLDSVTYSNGSKRIIQYNGQEQVTLYQYYEFRSLDNVVKLVDESSFEYNQNGDIIKFESKRIDILTSTLVVMEKIINEYDAFGNLVQVTNWEYDNTTNQLIYESKEVYSKNEENGALVYIDYFWNDDEEWEVSGKIELFGKENSVSDSVYFYQKEGDLFVLRNITFMTFNNRNEITLMLVKSRMQDGTFAESMKMTSTYNNAGYPLSDETQVFSPELNAWTILSRDENVYNTDGMLLTYIQKYLIPTTGQLGTVWKSEYSYDSNNNISLEVESAFDYELNALAEISKKEFTYYTSKKLDDVILPSDDIVYVNGGDFYDFDYYLNGIISKVKCYYISYDTSDWALDSEATYHYNGIGTQVDELFSTQFKIYPNPVVNKLTVDAGNSNDIMMNIHDLGGKIIFAKRLKGKQVIAMDNFVSGIYVIEFTNGKGQKESHKIVKK